MQRQQHTKLGAPRLAVELDAAAISVHVALARVSNEQGRLDQTLREAEKALELSPSDPLEPNVRLEIALLGGRAARRLGHRDASRRLYFELVPGDGGKPAVVAERRLPLSCCDNFRDLGGYPARAGMRLRWRRLFRSDALHGLTPEGADRVVDELGIGAIVDLRSTGEVGVDGRGPLRDRTPIYHHLPLFDGPLTVDPESVNRLTLADRYFLIAERAKAAGIEEVYLDRGGLLFHGKIKALADAAREGGLKFCGDDDGRT